MKGFRNFITEIFDRSYPPAKYVKKIKEHDHEVRLFEFWVGPIRYQVKLIIQHEEHYAALSFQSSSNGGQSWSGFELSGDGQSTLEVFQRVADVAKNFLISNHGYEIRFSSDHRRANFYEKRFAPLIGPYVGVEKTQYSTLFRVSM